MLSGNEDYLIAWIIPLSGQQEVAQQYIDGIANQYSSPWHITYTFGRVGAHNVVLASPASDVEKHDTDYIIKDLLRHAPFIRAGFLVSSDAVAPRTGTARVGDIVVGGTLPVVQRGVVHLDAEKTREEQRPVLIGESRKVPLAVAQAVRKARDPQGREDWQRRLDQDGLRIPSHIDGNSAPLLEDPHLYRRKALLGVIASSTQHIKDTGLLEHIAAENGILCFETAASTMKSNPFLVVAGIVKYCEDDPDQVIHDQVCQVILSYLACIICNLDHAQLKDEAIIADQFQYDPFDLDSPGFRLLRLQGGTGPLRCHLFQAYLDDEKLVPYEALSYCWGSDKLTHSILLNDKVLEVTSNLCVALKHLRFPDRDRILWIDAICIDQGNVRERGHQVDHMGHVYRHADQVLFWLGHVTYEVTDLLSALQRFEASIPTEAWGHWTMADSRFPEVWMNTNSYLDAQSPFDASQQSRLELLLENEWFRRVWIIQEVFNAKRALLGCSEGWINARTFALAPILLQVEPNTQCQAIIDVMPGPSRKSSWWNQKPNLSTLLWKFRESQATDPRDRVFALLDIASDKPFKSDYSKNDEAVGKDAMQYLCRDNTSLMSQTFPGIPALQNMVPNLLYMDLDHMSSFGMQGDVELFGNRHNKQVFLSESVVGYHWYIQSPLQEQLIHESSIVQVVSDEIHGTDVPRIAESLAAYLKRNKGAKVTPSTLFSAQKNGFKFSHMMVEKYRDDIEVTEALAMEAAKNGPEIFDKFLDMYRHQIVFTERFINAATDIGRGRLDLLLHYYDREAKITDVLLIDAIRRGPKTVRLLLDMYLDQLEISEATILEAILHGHEMLQLLFDVCGEKLITNQMVAREAMQRERRTFEVFLDNRGDQFEIDASFIEEAFDKGQDVFKLLVNRCGSRITCTTGIIDTVSYRGSDMLEVLLDGCGDQIVHTHKNFTGTVHSCPYLHEDLDRRWDQIPCTDEVVWISFHRGPDMLKVALHRYGNQISCVDEVIRAAFSRGSDMLKVVLDQYGDQTTFANKIVSQAIDRGPDTLRVVLSGCGYTISHPDEVVWTSFHRGSDMLKVALDRYGDQITCATELIIRAMDMNLAMLGVAVDGCGERVDIDCVTSRAFEQSSDFKTLEMILDKYGNIVQVPPDAFMTMLRHGRTHNVELLLARYGYRDDILNAFVRVRPKRALLRYCGRALVVDGHLNVAPWLRLVVSAWWASKRRSSSSRDPCG
ncbi:hypothetical protein G7054_g732 [Neopestalotiopsis clavispora]|nr:hypothetical protein G7054_g732 [Neopestalotiopsis clavispora]